MSHSFGFLMAAASGRWLFVAKCGGGVMARRGSRYVNSRGMDNCKSLSFAAARRLCWHMSHGFRFLMAAGRGRWLFVAKCSGGLVACRGSRYVNSRRVDNCNSRSFAAARRFCWHMSHGFRLFMAAGGRWLMAFGSFDLVHSDRRHWPHRLGHSRRFLMVRGRC